MSFPGCPPHSTKKHPLDSINSTVSSSALNSWKNIPFYTGQIQSFYPGPHNMLPDFMSLFTQLHQYWLLCSSSNTPSGFCGSVPLAHNVLSSDICMVDSLCRFMEAWRWWWTPMVSFGIGWTSWAWSLAQMGQLHGYSGPATWIPWSLGTVLSEGNAVPFFIEQV